MFNLLLVLTPISLIDSTSVIPFAVVVLAVLLGGPRPYAGAAAFLLGMFLSYLAAGILIVLGLGAAINAASGFLAFWWRNPDDLDYAAGIVAGVLLVLLGYRLASARRTKGAGDARAARAGMTPLQAFLFGAGSTIAGLWGALPYFAAIDQILKADVSAIYAVAALLYYNVIFALPLASLVLLRAVVGERASGLFDTVNRLFSVWGRRVLIAALVALGLIMVADGIGWFLGRPLIPV